MISVLTFSLFSALKIRTQFTKGGICLFKNLPDANYWEKEKFNKNCEGFYGWMGAGGSIFQWHPELEIGFAFIPTFLHALDMFNERGAKLQQLVKDCCINA